MAVRTVLVTGATGLLGRALVPAMQSRGWQVVALGHRVAADLQCDLGDAAAVTALLDRMAPDVIVHLAALTNVDTCEAEPDAAYRLNVRTVEHLAAWTVRARAACHLVHISSDQVYDGPGPHREDAVCITNTYAFSKRAGEIVAATAGASVLRTNFYGPGGMPGRPSFSDWLHGALSEGRPIEVFDDVLFNPMAMDRLTGVIARVAAARPAGIFNIGARHPDGGLSKADFAFAFAAAAGLPTAGMRRSRSTAATARLKAYRPKDMRMDCRRIESVLDRPLPELTSEIHRIASAYRAPT